MKFNAMRLFVALVLAIVGWLVLLGATSKGGPVRHPDKLVILSTTDVKGKTSPCG